MVSHGHFYYFSVLWPVSLKWRNGVRKIPLKCCSRDVSTKAQSVGSHPLLYKTNKKESQELDV